MSMSKLQQQLKKKEKGAVRAIAGMIDAQIVIV